MSAAKYSPAPTTEPPPNYEDTVTTAPSAPAPGGNAPPPPGPRRLPLLSLPVLNHLRDGSRRVILASQSPNRKAILAPLFPNLEQIPSAAEENLSKSLGPWQYVLETASLKAQTVYRREIEREEETGKEVGLILAGDTVVVSSAGQIMEKPRSEGQHISMLKTLRDTGEHKVYSAVVAMTPLQSARDPGYAIETTVEETIVKFDPTVTDDLIMAYVRTREGANKAGGYGLQGLGSILVEKIDGSHDNVIGMPLAKTLKLIEKVMSKADDEDLINIDEMMAEDMADKEEEELE